MLHTDARAFKKFKVKTIGAAELIIVEKMTMG